MQNENLINSVIYKSEKNFRLIENDLKNYNVNIKINSINTKIIINIKNGDSFEEEEEEDIYYMNNDNNNSKKRKGYDNNNNNNNKRRRRRYITNKNNTKKIDLRKLNNAHCSINFNATAFTKKFHPGYKIFKFIEYVNVAFSDEFKMYPLQKRFLKGSVNVDLKLILSKKYNEISKKVLEYFNEKKQNKFIILEGSRRQGKTRISSACLSIDMIMNKTQKPIGYFAQSEETAKDGMNEIEMCLIRILKSGNEKFTIKKSDFKIIIYIRNRKSIILAFALNKRNDEGFNVRKKTNNIFFV